MAGVGWGCSRIGWVRDGGGSRGDWAYVCSVDWCRGLHTANGVMGFEGDDRWCRRERRIAGALGGNGGLGLGM